MTVIGKLRRSIVVEAGEYECILTSIDEADGEFGPCWKWSFEITTGEQAGIELVGITSTTYSEHPSKAYTWARALGHPADIDFNASLIENRPCRLRIRVEDQKEGDGQRNRTEAVGAPTKAQLAAQPPSSEEIPF